MYQLKCQNGISVLARRHSELWNARSRAPMTFWSCICDGYNLLAVQDFSTVHNQRMPKGLT